MKPLLLDLSDASVLIFGEGAVGRRKADYFSGCRITFITRTRGTDVSNLTDEELNGIIAEHDIIIAALPDANLNDRICTAAKQAHKLYNSATSAGNFLIPSVWEDGPVTIAVSTNGKAPALSAYLRDEIAKTYPHLAEMAELQNTLRKTLKDTEPDAEKRMQILRNAVSDSEIWESLPDAEELFRRKYL